jgi:hypothetical protein
MDERNKPYNKVFSFLRSPNLFAISTPLTHPVTPKQITLPETQTPIGTVSVSPNVNLIACHTETHIICIDDKGTELWDYELKIPEVTVDPGYISSAFSDDSKTLWVYRPESAFQGCDFMDVVIVLDARTGREIARVTLGSSGQACVFHTLRPEEASAGASAMILDIGGMEKGRVYVVHLKENELFVRELGIDDRYMLDVSPDRSQLVSVSTQEIVFQSLSDGRVIQRVSLDEIGLKDSDMIDVFPGGYLDENVVIVVVSGEDDDSFCWRQFWKIDGRTGGVLGPFGDRMPDDGSGEDELFLAGDGSYLEEVDGLWVKRC